jgi:hypothetical protein
MVIFDDFDRKMKELWTNLTKKLSKKNPDFLI